MAPDKYAYIRDKGRYRIQSVDFGTFLEKRDAGVVLRNLKPDRTQQWVFRKVQDNVFEIASSEDPDYLLVGDKPSPFALRLDSGTNLAGSTWTFYIADSRLTDRLNFVSAEFTDSKRTHNYLVHTDDYGVVSTGPDNRVRGGHNFQKWNPGDDYLWRLVEVNPASLPDENLEGKYRIRTLNGMVIHSLTDQDTLSILNQNRGDHRAWNIKDMGNGMCTLYNVLKKKYLATKYISGRWIPVFSDAPPTAAEDDKINSPWRIVALNDINWSIYVLRSDDGTASSGIRDKFSLTLDEKTVILKRWKKAHNQIWMIEATDAPLPEGNKNAGTGNTDVLQGSPLKQNVGYKFNSSDNAGGIRVFYSSGTYAVSLTNNTDFTPSPISMEVKPSGQDGEVYIFRAFGTQKHYLTWNGYKVTVENNPYSWTIEKAPNPAYYVIRDTQSKLYLSRNVAASSLETKAQADATTYWAIAP
ncbi:hypothetical protein HYPSUDRAFT_48368 [Hypholoma sublateritium FD-334 SS-4]|uniref:Uncharacterized protein n=1 Tax=Hypholoma sublateritium (strain FD-334 SS-4) TaxID=945553 RepID=A0A0D2KLD4_HYPSF|nr:hypothetical protein HYPSUDRAFT_48368 [Hypholoma sublateritium FD-334 SS-4]